MHSDNFRRRRSLLVNLNYCLSYRVFSIMPLKVPRVLMVIGVARELLCSSNHRARLVPSLDFTSMSGAQPVRKTGRVGSSAAHKFPIA
jgi:hypothetical protein